MHASVIACMCVCVCVLHMCALTVCDDGRFGCMLEGTATAALTVVDGAAAAAGLAGARRVALFPARHPNV